MSKHTVDTKRSSGWMLMLNLFITILVFDISAGCKKTQSTSLTKEISDSTSPDLVILEQLQALLDQIDAEDQIATKLLASAGMEQSTLPDQAASESGPIEIAAIETPSDSMQMGLTDPLLYTGISIVEVERHLAELRAAAREVEQAISSSNASESPEAKELRLRKALEDLGAKQAQIQELKDRILAELNALEGPVVSNTDNSSARCELLCYFQYVKREMIHPERAGPPEWVPIKRFRFVDPITTTGATRLEAFASARSQCKSRFEKASSNVFIEWVLTVSKDYYPRRDSSYVNSPPTATASACTEMGNSLRQ